MATNTTNYRLIKPDLTDYADITVLNQNSDTIDAALSGLQIAINNNDAKRASKTVFGQVRVGDNLNVSGGTISAPVATNNSLGVVRSGLGINNTNGVLSAQFINDNTILPQTEPSYFQIGEYLTAPTRTSADAVYVAWRDVISTVLNLIPNSDAPYKIFITTQKRNNISVSQEVKVYYANSSNSDLIGTMTRTTDISDSSWLDWSFSRNINFGNVNPEGVIIAFKGGLYFNTTNNVLYVKSTGAAIETNTGWIEFGAQKITDHSNNLTIHTPYGIANGTNAKTVTLNHNITSYTEGMSLSFKNTVQNTGNVTINVNNLGNKSVLKSNGSQINSGFLKANSVYTIRYNGTSFFLQGEGGEYGTATSSQVLSGYTLGTESGIVNGSMANKGAVTSSLNAGGSYTIPAGYHNGSGLITANSLASQTSANATAAQILSGRTAWVNGSLVTGTIPSRPATTITPSTSNQTINAGQYLNGVQTILGDADLIAANIISGKNIFGVNGTATINSLGGRRFARGSAVANNDVGVISVNSLNFTPSVVVVKSTVSTQTNGITVYANSNAFSPVTAESANAFVNNVENVLNASFVQQTGGFRIRASLVNSTTTLSWIAFE